jgi:hypothetical protein
MFDTEETLRVKVEGRSEQAARDVDAHMPKQQPMHVNVEHTPSRRQLPLIAFLPRGPGVPPDDRSCRELCSLT